MLGATYEVKEDQTARTIYERESETSIDCFVTNPTGTRVTTSYDKKTFDPVTTRFSNFYTQ
jgi:hypothetical protein